MYRGKRLVDLTAASLALVALSPFMGLAALVVLFGDGRPVLYRATRLGQDGRNFTMLKFRTMRQTPADTGSAITAPGDARVFRGGRLLRTLNLDELPQLLNVVHGEMSIIGPRPEDPAIVQKYYAPAAFRTLAVPPGLAGPGSLWNYTHGADLLKGDCVESSYLRVVLPTKLALDAIYVERMSFGYDLRMAGRVLRAMWRKVTGRSPLAPPELKEAQERLSLMTIR